MSCDDHHPAPPVDTTAAAPDSVPENDAGRVGYAVRSFADLYALDAAYRAMPGEPAAGRPVSPYGGLGKDRLAPPVECSLADPTPG